MPQCLKHVNVIYKLVKKSWTWYSTHVTSYSPNMLNGVSRHGSPFTRPFADPKWTHALSLTFEPNVLQKTTTTQNYGNDLRISNFWFKNKNLFQNRPILPDLLLPKPKIKEPGAPLGSLQWSSSFGMLVFLPKCIIWIVRQKYLRSSARATWAALYQVRNYVVVRPFLCFRY